MRSWSAILVGACTVAFAAFLWLGLVRLTPLVVAVTPSNEAHGVYPDTSIAISFSRPMAGETISSGTIVLRDGDAAAVATRVTYDARRRIAQVTPKNRLRANTTYSLQIGEDARFRPHSTWGLPLSVGVVTQFDTYVPLDPPEPDATPILVVTDPRHPSGSYYAEILRAEGLNLFSMIRASDVTPQRLESADIVIVTNAEADTIPQDVLADWVNEGGNLIAFEPTGEKLSLFGLAEVGPPVPNGYLRADPESAASRGIVQDTLQLRVVARRYDRLDGTTIAHLFEAAGQPTGNPAVTLRKVGAGHAAAFAYDLAQSVILTRQGNPDWINQERDGLPPRRTNDLFFPDHLDMAKVGIPQADEQQRLLANLILTMNEAKRPLPRFGYLPGGRRAAIVLAGDDHGTARGTLDVFSRLAAESPAACRVDLWECYRATSYFTLDTPLTTTQIADYSAAGFEFGIHLHTGCRDQDNASVGLALSHQVTDFGRGIGIADQQTHRMHCVIWNGWVDTAKSERAHGIRLNMNYYYWPGSWVRRRPGFMTGSGFPMRFADTDGTVLDIYQATTHLVNENGIDHGEGIRFLIDRALGDEQFFGAFGTYYDYTDGFFDAVVSIAKERDVPLISAAQLLRWLDGRATSRFDQIAWTDRTLSFEVEVGLGALSIVAMLPLWSSGHRMTVVECAGEKLAFTEETIKGMEYAVFPVRSGDCSATYEEDRSSGLPSPTKLQ